MKTFKQYFYKESYWGVGNEQTRQEEWERIQADKKYIDSKKPIIAPQQPQHGPRGGRLWWRVTWFENGQLHAKHLLSRREAEEFFAYNNLGPKGGRIRDPR